jgi:hypothetical protein
MSQADEKAERVRILQQDASARTGSTFLDHAAIANPEPGGRFARATTIQSGLEYPRLPSGPWRRPDPSGDEPPLAIDVNAMDRG